MRSGIKVLDDVPGNGDLVKRHQLYRVRIRMWLNQGDPVRWRYPWGSIKDARIEDDGTTLVTDVRIDRVFLVAGLFYGVEGMRVGGIRRLKISPHLAYGKSGLPDIIPGDAVLVVEIAILGERRSSRPSADNPSQN